METFELFLNTGLTWIAKAIEVAAAAILVVGAVRFVGDVAGQAVRGRDRDDRAAIFRRARVELGGYILASLEFLIVADILFTIVHRTLNELYLLALLTAIRTALSWFLTRELAELRAEKPPH